jgi:hypothetical protein
MLCWTRGPKYPPITDIRLRIPMENSRLLHASSVISVLFLQKPKVATFPMDPTLRALCLAPCFSGIFEQRDPDVVYGQNAIHVHRVTVQVNDYDAFAGSDRYLNESWVHIPAESTQTGRPPQYLTALAVATKVGVGRMTSSQDPTPSAISARCNATVPLQQGIACLTPQKS